MIKKKYGKQQLNGIAIGVSNAFRRDNICALTWLSGCLLPRTQTCICLSSVKKSHSHFNFTNIVFNMMRSGQWKGRRWMYNERQLTSNTRCQMTLIHPNQCVNGLGRSFHMENHFPQSEYPYTHNTDMKRMSVIIRSIRSVFSTDGKYACVYSQNANYATHPNNIGIMH